MKKASRLLLILLIIAVILIAVLIGPPQILQHLKQGIIVGNATPTARYASTSITFPRHDGTPTPGSGTSTTHSVFTPSFPTGMPHVLGTQVVDSAGHKIVLRGAQLEPSFNYIKSWQACKMPPNLMLPRSPFKTM